MGVGFRAVIRKDRSELNVVPWPTNEFDEPSTSWGKEAPALDARHSAERIFMHAVHMFARPLAPERNRAAEPHPTLRVHVGTWMRNSEDNPSAKFREFVYPHEFAEQGSSAVPRP